MVLQKLHFDKSEVLSYLEGAIISDEATELEIKFYEDYHWYGSFDRSTYEYKMISRKMKRIYNGE